MANTVFITGATGNIGGMIVARLIDEGSSRLVLLVRAGSPAQARQRIENTVRILSPQTDLASARERIRVVTGDTTLAGFGLEASVLRDLTTEVTHIIHAAAATKFTLPLDVARQTNLAGTRSVMAFAQRARAAGQLVRVAHISTAFVCGERGGTIYEDRLIDGQEFTNSYERAKWEAERHVRSLMPDLPVDIFRPSIVVGDSRTGHTLTFNVLYPPLKLIFDGLLKTLPCSSHTHLDVVPLDFVAGAFRQIFFTPSDAPRKTYHLTTGCGSSPTVGDIVEHACARYARNMSCAKPSVIFLGDKSGEVDSSERAAHIRVMHRLFGQYGSYVSVERSFDTANTLAALAGTDITVPTFADYADRIIDYFLEKSLKARVKHAA